MRKERIATRGRATNVAKWTSTTFLTWLGVGALAVAIAAAPADAKKRKDGAAPDDGIADLDKSEPMVLVVSLKQQKLDVYRGTTLVTTSQVSTGMPGHATKAGVFSILEKQRFHHSNIYSGAPMPFMNRITWSGTALHAGVVPGYPASHGCIRLPFSFAPKLFQITTVGDNVIVARDRPVPQLIDHPALFQPLPPPAAPALVTQEPPQRQSMNDILPLPAPQKPHPGMLARADVPGSTTDVPPSFGVEAAGQGSAPTLNADDPVAVEDTHAHAFDPFAGQPAAGNKNQTASTSGHALDDAEDGVASKPSDVAAKPVEKSPVETPAPIVAKAPAALSCNAGGRAGRNPRSCRSVDPGEGRARSRQARDDGQGNACGRAGGGTSSRCAGPDGPRGGGNAGHNCRRAASRASCCGNTRSRRSPASGCGNACSGPRRAGGGGGYSGRSACRACARPGRGNDAASRRGDGQRPGRCISLD